LPLLLLLLLLIMMVLSLMQGLQPRAVIHSAAIATAADAGCVVVPGSHGGRPALPVAAWLQVVTKCGLEGHHEKSR
jgi:hypothetical protein